VIKKLLHTADWHLSADDIEEKIRCCSEIINYANTHGIDLIVISGDVFDKNPSPSDTMALVQILSLSEVDVIIVYGNHDTNKSLDFLPYLKTKITVVKEITPEPVTVNGINCYCLPHVPKAKINTQQDGIKESNRDISQALQKVITSWQANAKKGANVIIGHLNLIGCKLPGGQIPMGASIEVDPSLVSDKIPVLAGHIHKWQVLGSCFYSGSPTRQTFDDLEDKGFYVFEIDDETGEYQWESVQLNTRMLYSLGGEWDGAKWQIENQVNDFGGCRVKFKYRVKRSHIPSIDYKQLNDYFKAKNVGALKLERVVEQDISARHEEISRTFGPRCKLRLWQEIHGEPEDNETVFTLLDTLLEEVGC
jgi:DNA repair exonuclease SbcCD nuclease subunit